MIMRAIAFKPRAVSRSDWPALTLLRMAGRRSLILDWISGFEYCRMRSVVKALRVSSLPSVELRFLSRICSILW